MDAARMLGMLVTVGDLGIAELVGLRNPGRPGAKVTLRLEGREADVPLEQIDLPLQKLKDGVPVPPPLLAGAEAQAG